MRLAASSCTSRFCSKCTGDLLGFEPNKQNNTHSAVFSFSSTTTAKEYFCFSRTRALANALAVYEPRSMGFAADSGGPNARARQIPMQSRAENRRACSRARSTPPPPHLTTRRAQAGAAACWMPRCSSFNIWRGIASASWPTWRRQASTRLSSAHALRRGCQSAQPRAARRCWV